MNVIFIDDDGYEYEGGDIKQYNFQKVTHFDW